MKLIFSEATPDYSSYIFPYVIWAFPEPGEDLARIFDAGFLPSSRLLDRFYMARQVRVRLSEFKLSSENRRVLRKCDGVRWELLPREQFEFTAERRAAFKAYADERFGTGVMSDERLTELFRSRVVSHVLQFKLASGEDAGTVVLLLHEGKFAFYYYAFYNLKHFERNLGMYMMLTALKVFQEAQFEYLYLGTCYSERALYKTQFAGCEFFNGVCWSSDLRQLKYALRREMGKKHLLEDAGFMEIFDPGHGKEWVEKHGIRR